MPYRAVGTCFLRHLRGAARVQRHGRAGALARARRGHGRGHPGLRGGRGRSGEDPRRHGPARVVFLSILGVSKVHPEQVVLLSILRPLPRGLDSSLPSR